MFRIERNPADHLSFGHGPHVCAGLGNSTRSYDKLPVLEIEPA